MKDHPRRPASADPVTARSADLALADARRTGRLLWAAFWTMLASLLIGLPWDAAWHTARRFETPFSPPHLFVYVTTALTVAQVVVLVTTRRLRRCFGPGFRVPGVPYRVPGALALVGAGLAILGLGAILDVIWHSAFGLDETRWSTPHAMLGWGWGLAALGFVAGRLALQPYRPLRWWTRAFLGLMLLGFSIGPILGPFQSNHTPEKVAAIATIPALAEQPEYQHTARIYQEWHLTRANLAFVLLGGLWIGLALALLVRLDQRASFMLLLIAFWTVLAMLRDRGTAARLGLNLGHAACWLPVPLLPAALGSVLVGWSGRGPLLAAATGGAVFGLCSQAVWPALGPVSGPVVGTILGAPASLVGVWLGGRLMDAVERPTWRRCAVLVSVVTLAPFASGLVDLYLRLRTPWS